MKATELRIGNALQRLDGSIFNVTIHDLGIIHNWTASERLLPSGIPLTEEWLLKFGLLKSILDDHTFDLDDWYSLKYQPKDEWTKVAGWYLYVNCLYVNCMEYETNTVIQYVHQLQNLYFAITGEELIVNNK